VGRIRTATIVACACAVALLCSGCWFQAGWDWSLNEANPHESVIGPAQVPTLTKKAGGAALTSAAAPAVADPYVYWPLKSGSGLAGDPQALCKQSATTLANVWCTALPGTGLNTPAVGGSVTGGTGFVFVTYHSSDLDADVLQALDTTTGNVTWTYGLAGRITGAFAPTLAPAPNVTGGPPVGYLYVTEPAAGEVVVVNTSGSLVKNAFGGYDTPVAIGDNLAYVGEKATGSIDALDSSTLAPDWSMSLGSGRSTFSVAWTPSVVYALTDNGIVG
jgi:outer membrane protein assembly factor BamB